MLARRRSIAGPTRAARLVDEFLALSYWKYRKLPGSSSVFKRGTAPDRQTEGESELVGSAGGHHPSSDGRSRELTYVVDVVRAGRLDNDPARRPVFNSETAKRSASATGEDQGDYWQPVEIVTISTPSLEAGFADLPRRFPDIPGFERWCGTNHVPLTDAAPRRHFRQL